MRKNQAVLPVAILILLLAGCPGNGGSSHSGGAVYTGGSESADGSPPYSARDLLDRSNAGDIQGIIALLTASGGAVTAGTAAVTFDASAIGLPEGGRVTLTVTVNGRQQVYRANADADGTVKFDVPVVPSGSEVTVRMDVENIAGIPFFSGTAEKKVMDGDSTFELTLKSMIDRKETYTGNETGQVDVHSNGNETIYLTLKDYILDVGAGSGSSAFAIRNSHPGTVTTVYVDIQGTVTLKGDNHGGFKLCTSGIPGGTINVIFLSSSSGSLESAAWSFGCASVQVEWLEGASFTVLPGCAVSGMESGTAAGRSPYTDWDSFVAAAQNSSNNSSRFSISRE